MLPDWHPLADVVQPISIDLRELDVRLSVTFRQDISPRPDYLTIKIDTEIYKKSGERKDKFQTDRQLQLRRSVKAKFFEGH